MFEDLVESMQDFINFSRNTSPHKLGGKMKTTSLKKCMQLACDGWKVKECARIDGTNDSVFVWEKNGEQEKIRLSFQEQCVFLEKLMEIKNE